MITKTKAGPKSKKAADKPEQVKNTDKKIVTAVKLAHGKKWRAANEKVAKDQRYVCSEAATLVKETAVSKFKSTVELHLHLSQEARGSMQLPHQTGKKIKVAVATDEVIDEIAAGKINFDVLIAEPAQMSKLAKHARTLGPKGLMPNPKSGTVTTDVDKAKQELEGGKIEFRTDAGKNVHLVVGNIDTAEKQLEENIDYVLNTLINYKIKSATLTTTMGPGIKLVLPEVLKV